MVSPARAAVVVVTRGLDPRVHLLRKEMDCRVKPGNDVERSPFVSLFPVMSPIPQ